MTVKQAIAGAQCPYCGSTGPFEIEVTTTMQLGPDGSKALALDKARFDGASRCVCGGCNVSGWVKLFIPSKTTYYTVVLLYPDYLEPQYGDGVYVASIWSQTPEEAVEEVQRMASQANATAVCLGNDEDEAEGYDELPPPLDFKPLAVFSGKCHLERNVHDFS
ncbi:MAG TPA: hypothetical protein VFA48_06160 [Gammaproteobacteria bacterium]|nr:hypothetical protein [Gammaproteobacteria bacterium]